jgi:hypothetical protein
METLNSIGIPQALPLSNGKGWLLRWDEGLSSQFEIACHSRNADQVASLQKLLSQGHQKALAQLVH